MRDFWFAIIPHTAHVNLQLADGADLPNPDGRIEGTGKRIRHVKVRSVEDASLLGPRGRRAQVAHRAGGVSGDPRGGSSDPGPGRRWARRLQESCIHLRDCA